jgi:hypothetical protein
VREHVAEQNGNFKLADMEELIHEAIFSTSIYTWTEDLKSLQKEIMRDGVLEPVLVNLRHSKLMKLLSPVNRLNINKVTQNLGMF